MLFANLTIRLLGSDDFPPRGEASGRDRPHDRSGRRVLTVPIADPLPLERIAEAHDRVDAGTRQRILLAMPG